MYNLTFIVAGLTWLSFTVQPGTLSSVVKGTNLSSGTQTGVYLNPDDFTHSRLSHAADCAGGNCTIRLHALFNSTTLDLVCNGKKQVFSKDTIYGYRDCQKNDFRLYINSSYQILDTAGFYLYSINKLVQGDKIARPQTVYYFSVQANDPVQELTLSNLQTAFAGNTKFRYLLDAQFRSDKDLIAYDKILKTYKIKYLYSESLK